MHVNSRHRKKFTKRKWMVYNRKNPSKFD